MRHVEKAAIKFIEKYPESVKGFIEISNMEDIKGVSPVVSFTIQSDPIGEVGVNGLQVVDMLKYIRCLFESLDGAFPCEENKFTINAIDNALGWQYARTKNRELRIEN